MVARRLGEDMASTVVYPDMGAAEAVAIDAIMILNEVEEYVSYEVPTAWTQETMDRATYLRVTASNWAGADNIYIMPDASAFVRVTDGTVSQGSFDLNMAVAVNTSTMIVWNKFSMTLSVLETKVSGDRTVTIVVGVKGSTGGRSVRLSFGIVGG